jgi:cobalt/nickel transport system permease protein
VQARVFAYGGLSALGGEADLSTSDVAFAMIGVHSLIGIGEAAITGLTVGAVIATRPDLVWAARGLPTKVVAHELA